MHAVPQVRPLRQTWIDALRVTSPYYQCCRLHDLQRRMDAAEVRHTALIYVQRMVSPVGLRACGTAMSWLQLVVGLVVLWKLLGRGRFSELHHAIRTT
ncbi:hypothetical protein H257_14044 [Aphanomyces astaci]|uniref:Uncharacterized protein n=1 Tax=Aphanomyces astaci TaxID=112090 RepID=W4FSA8_APHAT|nr:hypothetical protein H257_14044 [Aphanomyces astaci]ETV70357.1 hypothetical protein H257_14044 [Aphanomyces astaci]|eukprot:XP_009840069.1 hypothetical protein H257_14044 [Aphanomyces astaci]